MAVHVLEHTALRDPFAGNPCILGQQFLLKLKLSKAGALNTRRHAHETGIHHFIGQADGLEQHGATVGGQRRNAHLRKDLEESLLQAFTIILAGVCRVASQFSGAVHIRHDLIRQPRVDRRGAHPEQYRHLMGIAGVASLDHDVGIGAQRQAAQVGVHRTHGQRCLNRQLAFGQLRIA